MNKKIYELPISQNYVSNWGLNEAIREIMQNAIDSEKDGHKMDIIYNNGVLSIRNIGVNLQIESLVLGNTGKSGSKYIGKYGEGYKLAIIVLLRLGYEVVINTNGQKWVPQFRKSRKFKVETIHFDVYESNVSSEEITFEISGIDYETFSEVRDINIAMLKTMGHGIGKKIETDYGEILLDKKFKGMMFVEGLFIQEDKSFNYGYNFDSSYVALDRDRKAINYYKLRELTAKAMTAHKDVRITETAIHNRYVDVRDIVNCIDDVSVEFTTNFANHFIKTHDIDEDTFVGLKKETIISKKEKCFVTESNSIAELVNRGLGKKEEYAKIKKKAKELSKQETAFEYYNLSSLKDLIEFIKIRKDRFLEEELEELVELLISEDLDPSYFGEIKDLIKESILEVKDE